MRNTLQLGDLLWAGALLAVSLFLLVQRRQPYIIEHTRTTACPSSPSSACLLAHKPHDVVTGVVEFQM